MTRLFDRIYDGLMTDEFRDQILGGGKYEPAVFDITNVAHYHAAHSKTYSDLAAFPNVAPPFGAYWMEWRRKRDDLLPMVDRVGALVLGTDGAGDPLPNDARWAIGMVLFMEGRRRSTVRLVDWRLLVSADGAITVQEENVSRETALLMFDERPRPHTEPPDDDGWQDRYADLRRSGDIEAIKAELRRCEEEHDTLVAKRDYAIARADAILDNAAESVAPYLRNVFLHPVLLAHSLMACKNVEQDEHEPPEKLSRKHQRKHGEPLVKFYTLNIKPLGGGARRPSETVDIGGGQTALHIVRGHFKTYTAERPLFGKRIGTYWWSPMTRGNEEYGEIVKDYSFGAVP